MVLEWSGGRICSSWLPSLRAVHRDQLKYETFHQPGALIEGAVIAVAGERVHLRPAGATVAGEGGWSRDGRAASALTRT